LTRKKKPSTEHEWGKMAR